MKRSEGIQSAMEEAMDAQSSSPASTKRDSKPMWDIAKDTWDKVPDLTKSRNKKVKALASKRKKSIAARKKKIKKKVEGWFKK